jgi:tRNA (cytidine56-2'-O)-methyltransferase
MRASVLRLGHRKGRDKRVTTHVCLAARALGASEAVLGGERDESVLSSVQKLVANWGGSFPVRHTKSPLKEIAAAKKAKIPVVHLTMYGERVQDVARMLRGKRRMLIVVGAEKVPKEVYELADYNVSVSQQPHSEIAALAVFLHELFQGKELEMRFPRAKLRIVPQARGKKVQTNK